VIAEPKAASTVFFLLLKMECYSHANQLYWLEAFWKKRMKKKQP